MNTSLVTTKGWIIGEMLKLSETDRVGWKSDSDRIRKIVEIAAQRREAPVQGLLFVKRFETGCNPVLLQCSDGNDYVVKPKGPYRNVVTDQIVGRLGVALGGPVAKVGLVDVPSELVDSQPEMSHFSAGVSHGSQWIPGCSNHFGFCYHQRQPNRPRFALLALLYGWAIADDHQFIYEDAPPRLVHSVDHCRFLAGGERWTIATLRTAKQAVLDRVIARHVGLRAEEFEEAYTQLKSIDDFDIAMAVSAPPDSWGITMDERTALAEYICRRRDDLLAAIQC